MTIDFAEILRDLEVKRAAALAPAERPDIDVERALAELEPVDVPLLVVGEDGGEEPFAPAIAGALVAAALAPPAHASGEPEADTAAARAIVRATTASVVARLAAVAAGGARSVTVHDLS